MSGCEALANGDINDFILFSPHLFLESRREKRWIGTEIEEEDTVEQNIC